MQPYRATVVGSFPRPAAVSDTMKRPTVPQSEIDEIIRWAVCEQVELGLETVTDGEGYRENMYYFYQKRLDGVSMEYMVPQSFGTAGFGIECARVVGEFRSERRRRISREHVLLLPEAPGRRFHGIHGSAVVRDRWFRNRVRARSWRIQIGTTAKDIARTCITSTRSAWTAFPWNTWFRSRSGPLVSESSARA